MSTLKRLSVVKNFEELESKVIELTKNNFNWITECQICDKNDDLFKDGTLGVQTRDSNIFNAFYTLFEKMDLL